MSEKIHPALFAAAAIYKSGVAELKEIQALKLPKEGYWERVAALDRKISARLTAEVGPISPKRATRLAGSDAFYSGSIEMLKKSTRKRSRSTEDLRADYVLGLMEFDAEHRYHTPLQNIVEKHVSGDRSSTTKFLRLEIDRESVRYGDGLPPFKGNIDHRILMQTALEFGFDNLTADQQAEFFDHFCPCDVISHDADDLRHLRERILKAGRQARARMTPKFTGVNQQTL
jgi:hypothetical protein